MSTPTTQATAAQKKLLGYAIRPENCGMLPSGWKFNTNTLKACLANGWLTKNRWGTYHITDCGKVAAKE